MWVLKATTSTRIRRDGKRAVSEEVVEAGDGTVPLRLVKGVDPTLKSVVKDHRRNR